MPAPVPGYKPGTFWQRSPPAPLKRQQSGSLKQPLALPPGCVEEYVEELRADDEGSAGESEYEMLRQAEEEVVLKTFQGRQPKTSLWLNVDSDNFNVAVGLAILGNAVLIGFETDVPVWHRTYSLLEHIFQVFFTIEVILRVAKHKWAYMHHSSHLFDVFLVVTGAASLYVVPLIGAGSTRGTRGGNMWVSTLRLLRLLRVLRILRIFKLFSELSLILRAFLKALSTVMWIGILKVILDYVIAVFLTQTVGASAHLWEEHEAQIHTWFGSIGSSMRTLFIVMTLAEWDTIAWTLMEVYPAMVVFPLFIAYIITGSYTTMSLVTGIISQSLLTAQHQDETHRMAEIDEERHILAEKLRAFLAEADMDHSGFLTREEVKKAFQNNPGFIKRLAVVDIITDYEQLDQIFDKMDDGSDQGIAIDTVAAAMLELNGAATASSIFELKTMVHQLRVEVFEQLAALRHEQSGGGGGEGEVGRQDSILAAPPGRTADRGLLALPAGAAGLDVEKRLEARLEAKLDSRLSAFSEALKAALKAEVPKLVGEVKDLRSQLDVSLDAQLDAKLEKLDTRLDAKLDAKLGALAVQLLGAWTTAGPRSAS